jgi:type III pantothenate kinase
MTRQFVVDIGNSRIKIGLVEQPVGSREKSALPMIEWSISAEPDQIVSEELVQCRQSIGSQPCCWTIGSVNRGNLAILRRELTDRWPDDSIRIIESDSIPIQTDRSLMREQTGVDRLLDAWAADRLRDPERPVVVIDLGSAITVDLVSAGGVYFGGAILPGIAMGARAMSQFTDRLPLLSTESLIVSGTPPRAAGRTTFESMRSGLLWGTVGAVDLIIKKMIEQYILPAPQYVITGGDGEAFVDYWGVEAIVEPNLTLKAIAILTQGSDRF